MLHIVVQKCKGDGLTSKGVNAAIRNLKYTANSEKKCGEVVDLVLNRLIDGGLAEALEEDAGRKREKGRRMLKFRWRMWSDSHGYPASDAFRQRLSLGADDFA